MSRSSLTRAHRPLVTVAALALLAFLPSSAAAAPGDLDPSFGSGGRAINAEADARGSAIVRTPDGGVVIAGEGFGASSDMFIVRKLTASGQPAPGFGGADGTAAIRVGEDANVVGVALHGDSSIVIGGDAKNEDDKRGLVAARMNGTSGAPDPSFGLHNGPSIGVTEIVPVNGIPTHAAAMALQANGYPIIAGEQFRPGGMDIAVTRLTGQEGDTSFGGGAPDAEYPGAVFSLGAAVTARPFAIAVDGQDRITITGEYYDDVPGERRSSVLAGRLLKDGAADTSFDVDGFAAYKLGEGAAFGQDVVLTAAGPVLSIDAISGGRRTPGVMRLTPGGAVDGGFGSGGVRLKDVGSPASGGPIGQDAAGRIVTAAEIPGSADWALTRFTPDGAVDGGFGSGGVSRFSVGPSAVPGDLFVDGEKVVVGGFVYDSSFHPRTAVARVLAGASTTGGTGGDTTATPAPGPAFTPVAPQSNPSVITVGGIQFTVTRSTKQRTKVPNVATGKLHFSRAHATLVDTVPYADVDFSFTHKNCAGKPGIVVGQTPDGGEVDTDPQNPVKFRLTVCLDSDEYVQTCSASKINKATKKAGKDSPAVVQAVLDELKKCRVDYDVKFSKKADDAVFRPATNLPAPKRVKRKPINQVVECPTDPAVQGLRIILDEGARSGNSYGFHASDPKRGWTLPAQSPSYFRVTVKTLAGQFAQARLLIDTDAVGAPSIPAVDLKRDSVHADGQRIIKFQAARPGRVRICALLEVASDDDGPQYVVGTTSFDVVPAPNVGDTWYTNSGRALKTTKSGTVLASAASAGPVARAAGIFDPVVNWWNWLWGDRSASVTKALQANQAPQKKLQQMSTSGNALGQIAAPGGVLGRMPELPRMVNGKIVYSGNGVLAEGTGPLVTGDDDGVLAGVGSGTTALGQDNVSKVVAAGGGNVVAPGGGNVVAPGGGNVVAPGGGNVVAPGGGNVVAPGGGNVVAPGGGNVVAPGGANLQGGGFVVAAGGGNVVAAGGAN